MECPRCSEEMVQLPVSSEFEGMRKDRFCCECNIRYGVSKSGLFVVSEPVNSSAIAAENAELRITIRTMIKIKDEINNIS